MKTLVIYFSYSGNNRLLAESLAKQMECDACPIIEKKRRTMLTIILDMIFKRNPKIEPLAHTVSDYDHLILVAPIWDSKIANPMKSLLRREKESLPAYSFISLCGYERAGQKESILEQLSVLTGQAPKAVCELKICELFPPEQREQIKTISRFRVNSEDLVKFETPINEFLKLINAVQ